MHPNLRRSQDVQEEAEFVFFLILLWWCTVAVLVVGVSGVLNVALCYVPILWAFLYKVQAHNIKFMFIITLIAPWLTALISKLFF